MGKYCPSPAASKLFILLGIARDTSRYCGVRDECSSRATCARTSWASATPSASRVWRKVVQVSANLPVFHSMLPGSATASLSPAMHRRSSTISGARNWLPDLPGAALAVSSLTPKINVKPKNEDANDGEYNCGLKK